MYTGNRKKARFVRGRQYFNFDSLKGQCPLLPSACYAGYVERRNPPENRACGGAIKTERTQIHFLSDVLVAVASLDLKVPFTMTRWYRDDFIMSFIWRINDSASINQVRWRQCNWFRLDRLQRTLEVLNWWLPLLQSDECLIHHNLKSTAQYPSLNIPTNAQDVLQRP